MSPPTRTEADASSPPRRRRRGGCLPLLDAHGVRATFYVQPEGWRKRLAGWKAALAKGQEIGNHSTSHPCTGNFAFSRGNAL